jgi:tRNA (guanine-N1)-methyltransferase
VVRACSTCAATTSANRPTDVHRTVDDAPFGGGAGMVMRAQPIFEAVEAVDPPRPLLLLGPGGRRFDQAMASELAALDGFSLLCGRYEGVDHRVRQHLVDGELSVGDVVLSGGEVAACLVIEAVTRLREGAMGNAVSTVTESFGESRAARGAPVHPPGRVPRLGGARGAAQRRPRSYRAVAAGAAAAPHAP